MIELIQGVERYCLAICSSGHVVLRVLGKSQVLIYPRRHQRRALGNCGALIESAIIYRKNPVTVYQSTQ